MAKPLKPFGVAYDPSIPRSSGWNCPQCDWSTLGRLFSTTEEDKKREHAVIGYSLDMPLKSPASTAHGILIFECPECFTKFWFHTVYPQELIEKMRKRFEAAQT